MLHDIVCNECVVIQRVAMLGMVVLTHVLRQQVLRLTVHDYGDHHGAAGTSDTLRRRGAS